VARTASSIVIARPIEDVFAVLTDVEKTGRWFPGDVTEWWTSDPPHGVGSTRRARVKVGPFAFENDAVATVYEPPRHAAMRGTSRSAPFEADLRFTPFERGTRVEVVTTIDPSGPMRLLAPAFARMYGRGWSRGLARLKRMMESGEL
jgi:uncharacterized protein YndB with AHSA1/START domain